MLRAGSGAAHGLRHVFLSSMDCGGCWWSLGHQRQQPAETEVYLQRFCAS